MSVLIVTSVGDVVVDLHTDKCPLTSKNFLKLCKIKYYNGCLFHKVQKDFTAQTGDRTGSGSGGDSVYKFLYGDQARFFEDEIHPDLKHSKIGTVAMASAGENCNASQFYFTLRDDLDYLDEKHTVFGIVEEKEGLETLAKINEAYVDGEGRPYKDIRIKHTYILDDPFADPPQLAEFIPEKSPEGKPDDEVAEERLEDSWVPVDDALGAAELEEALRVKEAHTNAAILESIGDIPDADIKPPENVLFVCKLNPVTQDEDLYTIFSRFGNVESADIIRDYKTGDSLCYAFIEFESKDSCELAYTKMDNTLIDDRRIHVDFSQSVSKLWNQFRHGRKTQTNKGSACFKCGAPDHFAKDCDLSANNKNEAPKYVLKDDNTQRGGHARESYEMVFGENLEDSPQRKVETHDRSKKQKTEHTENTRHRGSDRDSEPRGNRYGYENGTRAHKEDGRNRGTRRGEELHRERPPGEKESRKRQESSRHGMDDGDYRKRSSDLDRHGREDGDHGTRSSDLDHHHGREDGDHRRRSSDLDRRGKDEANYRKRSLDSDELRKDGGDRDQRRREDCEHGTKYTSDRYRRDDVDYGKRGRDRYDESSRDRRHADQKRR